MDSISQNLFERLMKRKMNARKAKKRKMRKKKKKKKRKNLW